MYIFYYLCCCCDINYIKHEEKRDATLLRNKNKIIYLKKKK